MTEGECGRKEGEDAPSVLVGCDNLCLPFEGREGWGVCEYEDAAPMRILHTHSPPPPMAEPPPGGRLIYQSPVDSRNGEGIRCLRAGIPRPYGLSYPKRL